MHKHQPEKRKQKMVNRLKVGHVVASVVLLLTDIADVITDWLFYYDVATTTKGIVYGPPSQVIQHALLAFTIIGSVCFAVEIVAVLLRRCCKDCCAKYGGENRFEDFDDVVSMLAVWLGDVPQLIISLLIALCKEEPISIFQLTKAIVVIFSLIFRIIILGVKYFRDKLGKNHKKIKVAIFTGNVLTFAISVVLFVLSNTEPDTVNFRVPSTVFDETVNEKAYFENVSVFVNVPGTHNPRSTTPANLVRLVPIGDVMYSPTKETSYTIYYVNSSPYNVTMAIWTKTSPSKTLQACFSIVNYKMYQAPNVSCTSMKTSSQNFSAVFIKLRFQPPKDIFREQLLGEVYVNFKKFDSKGCRDIVGYSDSLETINSTTSIAMHYYRTNSLIDTQSTYVIRDGNSVRFYRNDDKDIINVKKLWKTGWSKCEPTGSLGPVLDKNIPIDCSFN